MDCLRLLNAGGEVYARNVSLKQKMCHRKSSSNEILGLALLCESAVSGSRSKTIPLRLKNDSAVFLKLVAKNEFLKEF